MSRRTQQTTGKLLSVLALAMLFMAQMAPLWLDAAGPVALQICTAQGLKTITLNNNGPQEEPQPETKNHCPLCMLRTVSMTVPDWQLAPSPVLTDRQAFLPVFRTEAVVSHTNHQYTARGPPTKA